MIKHLWNRSFITATWLLLLFSILVILFAVYRTTFQGLVQAVLYLGGPLVALFSAGVSLGTLGIKSPRSRTVQLATLGVLMWTIAEVIIIYLGLQGLETFPSWADFFFLMGYPFYLLAVYNEWRLFSLDIRTLSKELLLWLSLLAGATIGIVLYLGLFVAFDPAKSLFVNAVAVSWSLADLVLGLALLMLVSMVWQFRKANVRIAWVSLLIAATLNIVADTFYALSPEVLFTGSWAAIGLDVLWLAGYFFLSYFFLQIRAYALKATHKIPSKKA